MTTILIIIAVVALCIAPAIYNHLWSLKAHHNVNGRYYGRTYTARDKFYSFCPVCSIVVACINYHYGWRAF